MIDYPRLLGALVEADVEFVIVGGLAATAHGSARLTQDLDVVYARSSENVERVARAMADLHPVLRGAPSGLPFRWDASTIHAGPNFTLTTDAGDVDFLGEIAGIGGYAEAARESLTIEFFGVRCLCLDLPALIRAKKAAARRKDLEAVAELEALLEERGD